MEQNIEPRNRPTRNGQLIFKKDAKATEWEKDKLFSKWCCNNWIAICNKWPSTLINTLYKNRLAMDHRDFPDGPVAKTLRSNAGGALGGLRSHMPHGQKNQNIKWKWFCNKFNKNLKNVPHQKKNLKKEEVDHRLEYEAKIIKFLRENLGESLSGLGLGKDFLNMMKKAQTIQPKISKLDIQVKINNQN